LEAGGGAAAEIEERLKKKKKPWNLAGKKNLFSRKKRKLIAQREGRPRSVSLSSDPFPASGNPAARPNATSKRQG